MFFDNFFEQMDLFPENEGWTVWHTGGNIYINYKDFQTKEGKTVVVMTGDCMTWLMKHPNTGEFIDKKTFDELYENDENDYNMYEEYEEMLVRENTLYKAMNLFDETIQKEILDARKKMDTYYD